MEKDAMNLEEGKEDYTGLFGRRKGNGKWYNYNLKNKRHNFIYMNT